MAYPLHGVDRESEIVSGFGDRWIALRGTISTGGNSADTIDHYRGEREKKVNSVVEGMLLNRGDPPYVCGDVSVIEYGSNSGRYARRFDASTGAYVSETNWKCIYSWRDNDSNATNNVG